MIGLDIDHCYSCNKPATINLYTLQQWNHCCFGLAWGKAQIAQQLKNIEYLNRCFNYCRFLQTKIETWNLASNFKLAKSCKQMQTVFNTELCTNHTQWALPFSSFFVVQRHVWTFGNFSEIWLWNLILAQFLVAVENTKAVNKSSAIHGSVGVQVCQHIPSTSFDYNE